MKHQFSNKFTIALFMLGVAGSANASMLIDTLEDIGADGTEVISRTIGDIEVSIRTAGAGRNLQARTYLGIVGAFAGAGGEPNAALNPDNVSGTRFISSSSVYGIDDVQPIIFDFSAPILGFGLTTLDLLEGGTATNKYVSLTALNMAGEVLDSQTRRGSQGPSGLDLDWYVSFGQSEISRVLLASNIGSYGRGFGIDDLVVHVVPLPASILFMGSGILGLIGMTRKKAGNR